MPQLTTTTSTPASETSSGYQNEAQQNADGNSVADLDTITVNGKKEPMPGPPVPNPLRNFASYTYGLSLWWFDKSDSDNLANCLDTKAAMSLQFGPNSYVVAEDSGLYPDQRLPTTAGLNYYLDDLQIRSLIAPSKYNGQSNAIDGSFVIKEPTGVTFVNAITGWAVLQDNPDYISQPYLLQIDFFGYDDAGNPIPTSQTEIYRKRYPIVINSMKIKITKGGSEYNCTFTSLPHEAYKEVGAGKLPKQITVNASTFGELLNGVANEYNRFHIDAVARGDQQFADSLKFDIDPTIASTSIVNPATAPLSQASPSAADATLTKAPFVFQYQDDMLSIIEKAFAQCDFLLKQIGTDLTQASAQPTDNNKSSADFLNTYKVQVQSYNMGITGAGSIVTGQYAFDTKRRTQAHQYKYNIHQYVTSGGVHPMDPSMFADNRNYVTKMYNYTFTGENTEVTSLDAEFGLQYYTAVLGFTNNQAAAQCTANSEGQNQELKAITANGLSPGFLIETLLPSAKSTKILAPARLQTVAQDMNVSSNLGGRSAAIMAKNIIGSKQIGDNDMVHIKLGIVGDPTLLKEDDWTYSPSPSVYGDYNAWDTLSQYDFAVMYGHLRMDVAEVIVGLQINTPFDIDTDYNNTGLVFPPMARNGVVTSLFSGRYDIVQIKSKFSKGKFDQVLELNRKFNQEYLDLSPPDSSSTSQGNQKKSQ